MSDAMNRAIGLAVVAACGGKAQPVRASTELTPALEAVSWILGDWINSDGSEHWTAANGALFGVGLHAHGFEAMVIDDGEGTGPADGTLRFIGMPNGTHAVEFRQHSVEGSRVTFANPDHDDPKTISYAREGSELRATLTSNALTPGTQTVELAWKPIARPRAPELEAADRAFAADVAARGIDGWVAAFAPDGGMLRKGVRVEGQGIRDMMAPLLAAGRLVWEPITSARVDDVGFTVGKATYTATPPEENWASSYVTIWKRQPDGGWKVWFDAGRVVQRAP